MTQPTQYYPSYNFTQYQASHPATPLPAASLDSELFNISASITEICQNLALIQRDDGLLANQSVGLVQLGTDVLTFMSATGRIRGAWVTLTAYIAQDVVTQGSGTYACVTGHTSGTFATDLAAGKWVLIAGSTGTTTYASLSDVLLTSLAANQLMTWNGTKWVNGTLLNANITAGTIAFDRMAAAFSISSTSLAGASNSNVPTTTAVKTYVDQAVRRGTGTPIASAATTSLTGNTFDYVHVTGAATITAVTLAQDEEKEVVFDGAATLTHNGTSLILPGAANIVTAANDRALFRGIDGTNVICLWYMKANGQALVANQAGVVSVKQQFFSSSGTYTPSAGMLYCIVESVDGGGGSGGSTNNNASNRSCSKGGNGGAYGRTRLTAAQIGASQTVTIGAGGAAGSSGGGNGGSGGATSLGSLHVGTTTPGGGGSVNNAFTFENVEGAPPGSLYATADFSIAGEGYGPGCSSVNITFNSRGGCSHWGKSYQSQFYQAAAFISAQAATTYGAGAGGNTDVGVVSDAGAAGFKGAMLITEYCSQ